MNHISRIAMIFALCMAASEGRAETDPVAAYCALLKERIHHCMRAYLGPQRSAAEQNVCAMAPGLLKARLNDALDALPPTGEERDNIEYSYVALELYVAALPRMKVDRALRDEELKRLPPVVRQACDRE